MLVLMNDQVNVIISKKKVSTFWPIPDHITCLPPPKKSEAIFLRERRAACRVPAEGRGTRRLHGVSSVDRSAEQRARPRLPPSSQTEILLPPKNHHRHMPDHTPCSAPLPHLCSKPSWGGECCQNTSPEMINYCGDSACLNNPTCNRKNSEQECMTNQTCVWSSKFASCWTKVTPQTNEAPPDPVTEQPPQTTTPTAAATTTSDGSSSCKYNSKCQIDPGCVKEVQAACAALTDCNDQPQIKLPICIDYFCEGHICATA